MESERFREGPVDQRLAGWYVVIALGLVLFLLPIMVIIHELGHTVAVIALGGEVTGYNITTYGASVTFKGIDSDQDLLLVHIAGVLANIVVGAYLLFHVWRFKGHPFQEAVTLIWGIVLLLSDLITYTIADLFYDHGGDFEKVYDVYPWAVPAVLLFDLLLVSVVMYVLGSQKFWKGIQLPREKVS